MTDNIIDTVAGELLSIPPLLRRSINRKVLKDVFAAINLDITLPHFEVLETLMENGSLPIAEIGKRLQLPKPRMTHLIDRLVRLEIAFRQPDENDRRICRIDLTATGRAMYEEHKSLIRSNVKDRLASLSQAELQKLSSSLRNLRDILHKLQES